MTLSIRQLAIFDSVASRGSVTAAAEAVGISQSAASSALQDLQTALGRQLLVRRGRALQLTNEGRRLQPAIRALLKDAEAIRRPEQGPDLSGSLVIGATSVVGVHLLPGLCSDFRARHPKVDFDLQIGTAREIIARMESLELETAIVENAPRSTRLSVTTFDADDLWLCASPHHPLARMKGLKLADLEEESWCVRERSSSTSIRMNIELQGKLGVIKVAFQANRNEAVKQAVISGMGIGCLSSRSLVRDLEQGFLVRLDVADFQVRRVISILRPKRGQRDPTAGAFDAFLERISDANQL